MVEPALANKNNGTKGYLLPFSWKGLDPLFYNLNKETKCLTSLPHPRNAIYFEVLFGQNAEDNSLHYGTNI